MFEKVMTDICTWFDVPVQCVEDKSKCIYADMECNAYLCLSNEEFFREVNYQILMNGLGYVDLAFLKQYAHGDQQCINILAEFPFIVHCIMVEYVHDHPLEILPYASMKDNFKFKLGGTITYGDQ